MGEDKQYIDLIFESVIEAKNSKARVSVCLRLESRGALSYFLRSTSPIHKPLGSSKNLILHNSFHPSRKSGHLESTVYHSRKYSFDKHIEMSGKITLLPTHGERRRMICRKSPYNVYRNGSKTAECSERSHQKNVGNKSRRYRNCMRVILTLHTENITHKLNAGDGMEFGFFPRGRHWKAVMLCDAMLLFLFVLV